MKIAITLIDINPAMISAWQETFEENPEITIKHGSMLEQRVDAWVTPTNSAGRMDGGLDRVIRDYLGGGIQKRVQAAIRNTYNGRIPIGHATCVLSMKTIPRFLISTPTMATSSEDISDTMNVALACCAAFQTLHQQNSKEPGSISSVALPGLGANTGRVPPTICADLMWTAYDLFTLRQFANFSDMRQALEEILGDVGKTGTPTKITAGAIAAKNNWGMPVHVSTNKKIEFNHKNKDFDDTEDF